MREGGHKVFLIPAINCHQTYIFTSSTQNWAVTLKYAEDKEHEHQQGSALILKTAADTR